ncbi:PHD finger transcription factor- putative [Striga hermonthica]|uniref:PHD finger transcription factor- putative n=1 Tax=Striga hermonthica TaxID=68872 RepID=A0A9N7RR74_STRHE|nr:PHD finger transcription factor- putative [Striga hermonthica]
MARGVPKQKTGRRQRLEWQPAGPHLIPGGAEYCPGAVREYLDALGSGSKKSSNEILMNVRKHLLYSGWKIDFVLAGELIKLRYSSPAGKYFYSLPQVCASLVDSRSSKTPISSPFSEGSGSKSPDFFKPGDEVTIDPDYCPEAVTDYCSNSREKGWKPGAMKAKQHLSALGWSFYYTLKGGGTKRELRYSSPNGRVFSSLLTACKWCVGANAVTLDDVIGKMGERELPSMLDEPLESDDVICKMGERELPSMPNEPLESGVVKKRGRKRKSCVTSKRVQDLVPSSSCNQNPRTVLSWLIDSGVVLPRARVEYRAKNGLAMAVGQISHVGIECSCCGKIFTLTKFEAHAGSTNHRPSANIFLEDGRSLMECQQELSGSGLRSGRVRTNSVETSGEVRNDDFCSICHDGGELVLCDRCPSSFHTECIGLQDVPDGDWFCPSCCCRICGLSTFEGEFGQEIGCSVLTCSQCEHRFRVGTDDMTWTLLKYVKSSDPHDPCAVYDEEGLLEVYGKLNVALGVMHECFEPLKAAGTGRDLIKDVIFSKWSGTSRSNFQGFYTIVLEKNDELISAATVRIYGKRVAEVPLVATRFRYRRLGMCRILMDELEKKLVELGVERLVLPAVPSIISTWTNSFGFSEMNEPERLNFLACTFLEFQGTVDRRASHDFLTFETNLTPSGGMSLEIPGF